MGYLLKVPPSGQFFIAGPGVVNLSDLDSHISRYTSKDMSSNLRTNLAAQHESVRVQQHDAIVATAEALKAIPKTRHVAPHPSLGRVPPTASSSRLSFPRKESLVESKINVTSNGRQTYLNDDPADVIEVYSSEEDRTGKSRVYNRSFALPSGLHGTRFSLLDSSDDNDQKVALPDDNTVAQDGKVDSYSPSSDSDSLASMTSSSGRTRTVLNPQVEGTVRIWPSEFWCVEIAEGLTTIDQLGAAKILRHEAFFKAFPSVAKFNSTTYSENRRRWLNASANARQHALDGGKTDAGKWKVFTMNNPSPDAAVRAAKKTLKRHEQKAVVAKDSDDDLYA